MCEPNFIGLTTCPHHASGNVGDQLITDAAIELIEDICGPCKIDIHFRREDFTSRLDYLNKSDAIILFGFPILESKTRPKFFRISESLDDVRSPIIPIAAAHKFFPGDEKELENRSLDSSTTSFIDRIVPQCPEERIPVRTEWVGDVLRSHGYKTILTGDPAWFAPTTIGEEFHKPEEINQLVFTTPHNGLYLEQAGKLLKQLGNRYASADRFMVLHSAPTDVDRSLYEPAQKNGWEIVYASHDVENIDFYRKSDLHVGYRKHGHLAHLRLRRPSVVLAEDSRAAGLTETLGTAGFRAFESNSTTVLPPDNALSRSRGTRPIIEAANAVSTSLRLPKVSPVRPRRSASASMEAIENVMSFLNKEEKSEFNSYDRVGKKIDKTYKKGMKKFIKKQIGKYF